MPRHPAPAIPAGPAEQPLIVTNPAATPHLQLVHIQPSAALTAHHLLNLPKTEAKPIQITEISPKEPMHISYLISKDAQTTTVRCVIHHVRQQLCDIRVCGGEE